MSQATRRTFLKHSAAFGAFVVAGTRASGPVFGANDRVCVGVAGLHGRGGAHIGSFEKIDGVQVTHLIDPDSRLFGRRANPLEKKHGAKPVCVQDIRKALDDKALHAVSVATCNHWHSLITVWACQAGKDVYVEKPCSHNVFEGRQCVRAARKYKRMVQHGTQRRSGGHWRTLRDIAAGKRGRLQVVRGFSFKGRRGIGHKKTGPPPEGLDFNIWLGPAPRQPYHGNLVHYNWHWFWDTGNGDIGNYGVHAMDICRWTIPNATFPTSVVSLGGRFKWDDQAETPNVQFAIYDFGQTKLIFEVSNLKTRRGRPTTVFDQGAKAEPIEVQSPPDVKNPAGERGPGGNIFANFIACVRSRKSEDLDGHILEGHYSSALCHLGNVSYRLGKEVAFDKKAKSLGDDKQIVETWEWFRDTLKDNGLKLQETTYRLGRRLQLDPETEQAVDDEEANRLLTRPYRAPFVVPEKV
ncbi:MAG: Gfo/Idh/MocA family protein [Candidatus Brocadiia bacterium]